MKYKLRCVLFIVLFIFFFISATIPNQQSKWKGEIEEENGVKVFKNPEEPLYGEIVFELEEDLSIGREDDENYMFTRVSDVEVDEEGNIYVLDFRECRIQKYDKDGNYLLTIGRKGQGPGEFTQASRMNLDKEKIYVNESRKIHIFDTKGEFKRSITLQYPVTSYGITKEGNILGHSYTFSEEGQRYDIVLVDPEGKRIKTIVSFPFQITPIRKGAFLSWVLQVTNQG